MLDKKGKFHPRAYARWFGVTIGATIREARRLIGLPSNPASDEGNEAP